MAASSLRSYGVAAIPSLLSSSNSKFTTATLSLPSTPCNASRFSMSAEWMPGQPRPPHLDGSAPGDFGFDPLGLGTVPENLERFKESELIHCRWAMLAVANLAHCKKTHTRKEIGDGLMTGCQPDVTPFE